MTTIPLKNLDQFGLEVPINNVNSIDSMNPQMELGASRYRFSFEDSRHLDALLVNQGTDTLIVTFHGALNRSHFVLPRFERIATTTEFGHSMLFFADPALWADSELELSWFTGWDGLDLQPILAEWAIQSARAVGAKKIIFTGSSGGGFAALQVSAYVNDSLCLAFNPQTSVYGYLAGGTSYGAQRKFMAVHYPELAPNGVIGFDFAYDWTEPLGERMSALSRYGTNVQNFVLYADNVNDFHHEQHLVPLSEALEHSGQNERMKVWPYDGVTGHAPPTPDQFRSGMQKALEWSAGLPDCI